MTVRTRRRRPSPFESQMLAAADQLFREFDNLAVLDVITALNAARRDVTPAGTRPDAAAIKALARERLAELTAA